jgi:hypothetical protein
MMPRQRYTSSTSGLSPEPPAHQGLTADFPPGRELGRDVFLRAFLAAAHATGSARSLLSVQDRRSCGRFGREPPGGRVFSVLRSPAPCCVSTSCDSGPSPNEEAESGPARLATSGGGDRPSAFRIYSGATSRILRPTNLEHGWCEFTIRTKTISGVKIRASAARWLSARPASRSVGQDRAPPWRALCASKGTRFWAFGLPQPVTGSQPGPAR